MHILSIQPEPPGSGSVVARFSLALSDDLRIFGLRLQQRADGQHGVYAPNSGGSRVMTFSPVLVDQIANAALAALEGLSPHDHSAA